MPKLSPRVANNYMLLSILLGNAFIFFVFAAANLLRQAGVGAAGLMFAPGVPLVIGQISVTLLPFAVYLAVTGQRVRDVIPCRPVGLLNLGMITLITITVMPLASMLAVLTMLVLGIGNNVGEIVGDVLRTGLGFAFVVIVLVPSVFEEIALRGVVLSNYRNVDTHKAALVNGLFFGIFHLNPIQFLYAFLLGYVFALLVIYTRSIFAAIFAHLVFNGSQVLLSFLAQVYLQAVGETVYIPDMTSPDMLLTSLRSYGIIAAIFTPVLIILLKSFRDINKRRFFREEFGTRYADNTPPVSRDTGEMALPPYGNDADTDRDSGRIVTASFVLMVVMYIIFAAVVI
ncbi:MAG: CPBP family intramembrane metalloprotease [Defluviitaleaceae bacterium]|nr:CPBP family intramembrane metalloprotease [Defluviitaleaceae bacterium]